jgi:hypothetical protein
MQPREILIVVLTLAGINCGVTDAPRKVTPTYDEFSRRLLALYADQDSDGRVDQWSYFDGNLLLRGEKDIDGDGRIDRWEYFDRNGGLERVGSASLNDGIEDTWTWPAAEGAEGRIDRSRGRDRHVDRREFYRNDAMVRAEEDTNGDGRVDRWDRYEGTVLRQAEFDTTLGNDRPNRRVVYDATGRFVRVETDPEFDGTFVATTEKPPAR